MKEELKKYIDSYLKPTLFKRASYKLKESNLINNCFADYECDMAMPYDINSFISNEKDENYFQKVLFKYIDSKNLKDSDVYNKVHIDRRLFSKIRNDINYHPSKETVILLGLALELNENEMDELLTSASYSLPKNNYYDLIIRFCFKKGIYEIKEVNDLLEEYNCKLFCY